MLDPFVISAPVLAATRTLYPVQGAPFSVRWVRVAPDCLAVEVLPPTGGEGRVLDLRRLERDFAADDAGVGARILRALTGR